MGIAQNRGIGELDQGQYDESREVETVWGSDKRLLRWLEVLKI
jgi:hypothetical protein